MGATEPAGRFTLNGFVEFCWRRPESHDAGNSRKSRAVR
jgi:hypothetical protein